MKPRSWHLDRRTFLRGTGVSLALPFMECMGATTKTATPPKRFCGVYFPYGVVIRDPDDEQARWNWFPAQTGDQFVFNQSHASLEAFRDKVTMVGGMSHPNGRNMGGHDTADIWLTGAHLSGNHLQNEMSIDQLMAAQIGQQTRYPSLVLSSDGGVGEPTRSSTLSFGRKGDPVPAINKPQLVFERLFGVNTNSLASQRQELDTSGSMLDLILDHSRSVRRQLGRHDQQKFDEYLSSVRQVEQGVERSRAWLDVPKPAVNAVGLTLDADDSTPKELMKTMYDLIVMAFQTDSTRVATYQLSNMNGATSVASKFPQLLGFGPSIHNLAHGARKGEGGENLGKWQQFLIEQFAYFLGRLDAIEEGEGSLLDNTLLLYGSSNANTHQNLNYPLLVAGGGPMGLKHGQYLRYDNDTPMANLLTSLFGTLDVPCEGFGGSTGVLPELFRA